MYGLLISIIFHPVQTRYCSLGRVTWNGIVWVSSSEIARICLERGHIPVAYNRVAREIINVSNGSSIVEFVGKFNHHISISLQDYWKYICI